MASIHETKPILESNWEVRDYGTIKWKLLVFMGSGILGIFLGNILSLSVSTVSLYSNAPFHELKIHYISKPFISDMDSLYAQKPGSGVDDAWSSLLSDMHMRSSAEELAMYGQNSVSLDGENEYFVWLDVFHHLHCINMLRKWIYRDYYHVNLSETETEHVSSHADHCLDILRQAVMCHPDPSLTTFRWSMDDPRPMFDTHSPLHTCVDFDIFTGSVRDRKVDEEDIRKLKNPLLRSTQ